MKLNNLYSITNGLASFFEIAIFSKVDKSISTLKCPELATIAPFFIFKKCSFLITFTSPVAVTKISPVSAAFDIGITENPSIFASKALMASVSTTMTFEPAPCARIAIPRPHQP